MNESLTLKLRIFIPFASGYFLSYLFRVVNAVIAPDLTRELTLGPADLGLITASYFVAFASFQLPLGVILDRFGPRRVEAILLLFAGIGAFVFAKAGTLPGLIVGRALIGFGVSACLMAAFKAYVLWFPKSQLPLINGCNLSAGGLGALMGTAPVEASLGLVGWRGVFGILGGVALLVALCIFFIVPETGREGQRERATLRDQIKGIGQVFQSPVFWRIAPLSTMVQATFMSIQGLWAGPWLRDVAGMNRSQVAHLLFFVAAAMVCGFLFLGALIGRLSRRGVKPMHSTALGMSLFMAFQIPIMLGVKDLAWPLWILFGFLGTSGVTSYAALNQIFPVHLTGRVNTGLNLLVFVTAFAAQWGIGALIQLWPVTPEGRFNPSGYGAGLGVMFFLETLALLWFVFFRPAPGDTSRSEQ
jgi:MFS family permease